MNSKSIIQTLLMTLTAFGLIYGQCQGSDEEGPGQSTEIDHTPEAPINLLSIDAALMSEENLKKVATAKWAAEQRIDELCQELNIPTGSNSFDQKIDALVEKGRNPEITNADNQKARTALKELIRHILGDTNPRPYPRLGGSTYEDGDVFTTAQMEKMFKVDDLENFILLVSDAQRRGSIMSLHGVFSKVDFENMGEVSKNIHAYLTELVRDQTL